SVDIAVYALVEDEEQPLDVARRGEGAQPLEPGADRLEVEMLACIGFAPRLHSRFRVVRPRRLRPGGIVGRIGQFGVGAQRRGENHPVVLEEGYFFRVLRLALPLATGFALALGAGFAGTAALPFPFGL